MTTHRGFGAHAHVFAILASGLLGMCLWGLGCAESDPPTRVGPTSPDRSSPQAVLASLREAYLNRRLANLDSLLAEDFEFYFAEEDQWIAEKCTRDEWVLAHWGLCHCEEVDDIALDFSVGELSLDVNRPDPRQLGEFLWTMLITSVDLDVRCRDDEGGTITFRLEDGVEQFWFRQEERVEPQTGQPIWLIVTWRELDSIAPDDSRAFPDEATVSDTTWGQVMSLFAGGNCP